MSIIYPFAFSCCKDSAKVANFQIIAALFLLGDFIRNRNYHELAMNWPWILSSQIAHGVYNILFLKNSWLIHVKRQTRSFTLKTKTTKTLFESLALRAFVLLLPRIWSLASFHQLLANSRTHPMDVTTFKKRKHRLCKPKKQRLPRTWMIIAGSKELKGSLT